jgi:hypothetical protein
VDVRRAEVARLCRQGRQQAQAAQAAMKMERNRFVMLDLPDRSFYRRRPRLKRVPGP